MKRFTLFISFVAYSCILLAQSTILSENFENGQPSGWTLNTLSSDGGWKFGTTGDISNSGFQIPLHSAIAGTNDNACSTCDKSQDYFITPSLDLTGRNNVFLSFYSYFYRAYANGLTEKATVEVSIDNGSNWTEVKSLNGSGAWAMINVDLSAYDGEPNVLVAFHYDDDGGWLYGWAIDDVSIYERASIDVSVSSVAVGKMDPTPSFVNFPRYIAGFDLTAKATIVNTGLTNINSFDLTLSDGVNTYNHTVTGLNVASTFTYTYTFPDPYLMVAGSQTLTATVSNVNGAGNDFYSEFNSLDYAIEGVVPNPNKIYLAEEGTGTWCGYCVRGIVFMDYMRKEYPDQFVGIAVHNGDPMAFSTYDNPISSLIGFSYPNVAIDRHAIIDPSELEYDFIERIAEPVSAKLDLSCIYSPSTNQLFITATGEFFENLDGDYRFACVIVEDSVHGSTSGYKQSNYYAGGGLGDMGGFEDLGSSIPASQMYYDAVGTALVGGFKGVSGSLPSTINSGEIHSHEFTYNVPSSINVNQMWVAGMILNYDNGEVVNANKANWKFNTGIANEPETASVFLYPNPAEEIAYLNIRLAQNSSVSVQVFDVLGQEVYSELYSQISNHEILPLHIKNLSPALYSVQISIGKDIITRTLVVGN